MAKCSFCGEGITKGTGLLFVKKDGTAFFFCSNKCHKNLLKLKRSPHSTKWTTAYQEVKKTEAKQGKKRTVRKGGKKKAKKRKKKRR